MVYADYAATTKMSRTAIDAMLPYMETHYGNPSSLYRLGQEAAEALQSARETVAACLGCTPREITFTSGGSEADNQALLSAAAIGRRKGKMHIISTAFEHHAILHTLKKLEQEGFEVVKTAANGEEALEYLRGEQVDLIIADIKMPFVTGLELLEKIRGEKISDAHFVILSGYADFEYARKAIRYDCTDYILKPVDRYFFLKVLNIVL